MPNQFLAGRSWFEVVVPISKTDRPATLSVPWKGSFASERPISEEIVRKRVNTDASGTRLDPVATLKLAADKSRTDLAQAQFQIEPPPDHEAVGRTVEVDGLLKRGNLAINDVASSSCRGSHPQTPLLLRLSPRGVKVDTELKPVDNCASPHYMSQGASISGSVSTSSSSQMSTRTRSSRRSQKAWKTDNPYSILKHRKVYRAPADTHWYPSHGSGRLDAPPPVPEDLYIPAGHLFLHRVCDNHSTVDQAWVRDVIAGEAFWRPIGHGDAFNLPEIGLVSLSISSLGTPAWTCHGLVENGHRSRQSRRKRPGSYVDTDDFHFNFDPLSFNSNESSMSNFLRNRA